MEYLGADSIVACAVGEEPFTVRVPGKLDLAAGARIGLAWRREAQHFFHARTTAAARNRFKVPRSRRRRTTGRETDAGSEGPCSMTT